MDIHSKKLKLLILKISYSNFNRNLENRIRPLTKFERSSYARIPEHEANQSWNQKQNLAAKTVDGAKMARLVIKSLNNFIWIVNIVIRCLQRGTQRREEKIDRVAY